MLGFETLGEVTLGEIKRLTQVETPPEPQPEQPPELAGGFIVGTVNTFSRKRYRELLALLEQERRPVKAKKPKRAPKPPKTEKAIVAALERAETAFDVNPSEFVRNYAADAAYYRFRATVLAYEAMARAPKPQRVDAERPHVTIAQRLRLELDQEEEDAMPFIMEWLN